MCDETCLIWGVNNIYSMNLEGKRVLEIGSLNVNGSLGDIVKKQPIKEYIGVDLLNGPGVDIVCDLLRLDSVLESESFDLVITANTFEHIHYWQLALSKLKKMCKAGGTIVFIAPSTWPKHDYPGDYWRYTLKDLYHIFGDCYLISIEERDSSPGHSSVFGIFQKPENFKEVDLRYYTLTKVIQEIVNAHR